MLKHTCQPQAPCPSPLACFNTSGITILALHGMFLLVATMAKSTSSHRARQVTNWAGTYHAYERVAPQGSHAKTYLSAQALDFEQLSCFNTAGVNILTLHGMILLVATKAKSSSSHRARQITSWAKTYHAYA